MGWGFSYIFEIFCSFENAVYRCKNSVFPAASVKMKAANFSKSAQALSKLRRKALLLKPRKIKKVL